MYLRPPWLQWPVTLRLSPMLGAMVSLVSSRLLKNTKTSLECSWRTNALHINSEIDSNVKKDDWSGKSWVRWGWTWLENRTGFECETRSVGESKSGSVGGNTFKRNTQAAILSDLNRANFSNSKTDKKSTTTCLWKVLVLFWGTLEAQQAKYIKQKLISTFDSM